jgi:hypothetical protein
MRGAASRRGSTPWATSSAAGGREPDAPVVITGSHVDTTLNAGAYDGVLGCSGAIEAVRALRERGVAPRRSIDVVAWAGEEPRFGTGCVGSRAAAGELERADLDRLVDRDGTSMAAALDARPASTPIGWPSARIDPGRCTRWSSCTSSRASCSRPTASRSGSSPRSRRPTTSA